jgi:rhodanese-related sulfurtransferase
LSVSETHHLSTNEFIPTHGRMGSRASRVTDLAGGPEFRYAQTYRLAECLEQEDAMATSVKQMLEAANAAVPRITPAQAREMIAEGDTLVVDVRDAPEVEQSGKVAGAVHVSRGMLEFRADPESPYHDKNFAKNKTIIVYCASGGRSALSGKLLKDMGYDQVFNLGAFKDWAEAGGAVDKPGR